MILTGESGVPAIQRKVKALVDQGGGQVAADDDFLISEALPKFKNEKDLALLDVLMRDKGTEVVIVDPLYLCMAGAEASNIQSQGELLWAISDLCRKAHVTLLVAHHVTKTAAKKVNEVLTLEDLTQAGFDAWARQWWLISRREEYVLGSGVHKFLIASGNCSSHSAEWAIDIDEGTKDAPKWDVSVRTASEVVSRDRAQKQRATLDEDIEKVRAALKHFPAGLSQSELKNKAGVNSKRWTKQTLPALMERGIIKAIAGHRKNCPHYVLEDA
jgi:hypothetical protein